MIIHHIMASGFRIVGERVEIKFPDEGRIGILGQNESGKTTLLQIIEYALYGLRKGAGVEGDRENLVTWGKNEAKLEIEFTSGQSRYNLQRIFGIKSVHKAILASVINGFRDKSSSITGLKDVETKIEQITGMDRDSFTKLVYIRQKDLDALKELAKSKREQLVNKVMGIELFDDASLKVKEDVSGLEDEFEKMNSRLDSVHHNKEEYESKQKQKTELETQNSQLEQALEQKKGILDEAKILLAKYDWLNNHNSQKEAISLMEKQAEQVTKDIERMSDLQNKINCYKTTISKHETEYLELRSIQDKLSNVERRLSEAEIQASSIETKRQASIEKLGLSGKDVELLSEDLAKRKNQRLVWFGVALVCGLAFLLSAFFTTLFLALIGFLFLGVAAYVFMSYLKIDRLIARNVEIETSTKQLQDQEKTISNLKKDLETLTSGSPLKTSKDTQNRLDAISKEMRQESGEGTLEGIRALQNGAEKSLEPLQASNPEQKREDLDRQIREKQSTFEELLKEKPTSIDEIQYGKKEHELIRNNCEKLKNEHGAMDKDIGTKSGTIQQLATDLEKLRFDYDLCPELEKETLECKTKIDLLKRVFSELSETSKELRNKVIPHARFIINQILPTLTADRYSDFEITEDLKFKVHSNDAGGYKEREIFSGGTQDQFLIALRLAFTQSILDSRVMADKYSLLMDECTSSSDDVRKQGIFEVLDAMKQTFSQIFIIAHEDISPFVDNHIVLDRNAHGYTEIKSKSW